MSTFPTSRFVPLALLALAAAPQEPGAPPPPQLDEARALLEKGQAERAREVAQLGLEHAPQDPRMLLAASRAAEAAGEADEALWYAALGLGAVGEAKEHEALAGELAQRAAALDPLERGGRLLFAAYAEELYDLGRTCFTKKLWLNAAELFERCRGTPREERARDQLQRMYENKRAVEALLEGDVDVPVEKPLGRSERWIALNDPKHADWENAWEFEGKNYTVRTNMGYAMGQRMLDAMEQMNGFYRKVFQYKQRGGTMARCRLSVYGTRAEFDRHEGQADSPGVKGFFVPGEIRVATYDPRTEPSPRSLASLWSTLFHEASHQFTRAISTHPIPAWLNEGTASYFEGARLLPNGSIETNLIPDSRLRNLRALLERGEPTVEDVVRYFEPGSYPGDYYPFGWGLVYFVRNWENERSERVYLPIYRDYLDSYTTGGKHDPFQRFVDFFVARAKVPGIDSFEAFEGRFREWILELHDLHFGPPEKADVLIARARKQRSDKKLEAAVESYRWALKKRPGDPVALFELGLVLDALDRKDAAILQLRLAMQEARQRPDPEAELEGGGGRTAAQLAGEAMERVTRLDRIVAERMAKADQGFAAEVAAAAQGYAEKGYPRTALQLLHDSIEALRGHGDLAALRAEITAEAGVDTRRWRRLPVADGLAAWEGARPHFSAREGAILGETEFPRVAFYGGELPDAFRLEARVRLVGKGEHPIVGLVYDSAGEGGMHLFALDRFGYLAAQILKEDPPAMEPLQVLQRLSLEGLEELALAIEIAPGGVEFFLDGRSVGEREYGLGELSGQIGLLVQDAEVEFGDLRVLH